MPLISRQVKPPARLQITNKVLAETAALLKRYAEFLDSTQDYVVNEVLSVTFRRDKEFQTWLAANRMTPSEGGPAPTSSTLGDEPAPAGRARK